MTFNQLWARECEKRPALRKPTTWIEMPVEAFQKLLKQVYFAGIQEEARRVESRRSSNPFMFIFGGPYV